MGFGLWKASALRRGREGAIDSRQQMCGKPTAVRTLGLVFHSPLLPCKFLSNNLNLIFLPPFGSNYLATDFQSIYDFSTHAVIGFYYITNSAEGIR